VKGWDGTVIGANMFVWGTLSAWVLGWKRCILQRGLRGRTSKRGLCAWFVRGRRRKVEPKRKRVWFKTGKEETDLKGETREWGSDGKDKNGTGCDENCAVCGMIRGGGATKGAARKRYWSHRVGGMGVLG